MMVLFPINEIEKNNYKILKMLRKLSKLLIYFKEDRQSVINLSVKILFNYIDIDNISFFFETELNYYFEISTITCFWISCKFIMDDDIMSCETLELMTNHDRILFVEKEREILKFLNYEIFKISNDTTYED